MHIKTSSTILLLFALVGMYGVLPTEPLHDIKELISNVVSEITAHLSDAEKCLCEQVLELVSRTKEHL